MRSIPYGEQTLPIHTSDAPLTYLETREPRDFSRVGSWSDACTLAARRLADRLRAKGRLALVVPDRTRPLDLPTLLPELVRCLADAGISSRRIVVVPASGIHAPMTSAEARGWVGDATLDAGIAIAPHDADAPGALLGSTPCGLPIVAHPAVADADAILTVGRIVFHYLAGFGGGRKMLAPGVCARRSVLAIHARCLAAPPARGRHPRARAGSLLGNPFHDAVSAAARLFPDVVSLHVVDASDPKRPETIVGDPWNDHARAAAIYADRRRVRMREPLDAVLVAAGGAPTDRDLVQSHKALDAIAPIVRDGGLVVLTARCSDGVGNPEVREWLRHGGADAIERQLRSSFAVGGHTALALREKTERFRVTMLTELDDETLELAGMKRAVSLEGAVAELVARQRRGQAVAVAPHGAALLYELDEPSEGSRGDAEEDPAGL